MVTIDWTVWDFDSEQDGTPFDSSVTATNGFPTLLVNDTLEFPLSLIWVNLTNPVKRPPLLSSFHSYYSTVNFVYSSILNLTLFRQVHLPCGTLFRVLYNILIRYLRKRRTLSPSSLMFVGLNYLFLLNFIKIKRGAKSHL